MELFDELELFGEFELSEELEPAGFELEPAFAVPPPDAPVPGEEAPVPAGADELPAGVTVVCVEPGSTAATAPAASTLAKPTVAVAAFSLRLPRSRSATARETWRAAARARADALRSSQLSIVAVCHAWLHASSG